MSHALTKGVLTKDLAQIGDLDPLDDPPEAITGL